MLIGIIKKDIKGKFIDYTELVAQEGYCFYDKTVPLEERNYITQILTPITDESVIVATYEAVAGDAERLNEELQREIAEKKDINA